MAVVDRKLFYMKIKLIFRKESLVVDRSFIVRQFIAFLCALLLAVSCISARADIENKSFRIKKLPRGWVSKPIAIPEDVRSSLLDYDGSPVDYFINSKIEEYDISPGSEAEKREIIRRATLDTLGVPPTIEEVNKFLSDDTKGAYERLVDRLLASPMYGERMAKKWMDLARYADSAGYDRDEIKPNNWRYRDYLIDSFNRDKPYNTFIQEQLAGDELWPDSYDARVATGFLAGYPDNSISRDLIKFKYEIETDITNTVGQVFLGATLACAQCHNHKYDRVSQVEYFQFQSIFAGVLVNEKYPVEAESFTSFDVGYKDAFSKYQDLTKVEREKLKSLIDPVRREARDYHSERYLTNTRESIFKDPEQWSALDKWVNYRKNVVAIEKHIIDYIKATSNPGHSHFKPAHIELYKKVAEVQARLDSFSEHFPARGSLYLTTVEEIDAIPAETNVRFAGIHERPLQAVEPAVPSSWRIPLGQVGSLPNSSARRSQLAAWMTRDDNPIIPRVYVNRVWENFFGTGIVRTLGDFGRAGESPSHPELLDYLAATFVENGWSTKNLVKIIMLSDAYQRSSKALDAAEPVDPSNRLLSYYPMKRLDAEQIRDSILFASGILDVTLGGPSVFPDLPSSASSAGSWWKSESNSENRRRSIYTFVKRSFSYPFSDSFDSANPSVSHHIREVTVTPLQSLTLMNSELTMVAARYLAGNIIRDAGGDLSDVVSILYETIYSRLPSDDEMVSAISYIDDYVDTIRQEPWQDEYVILTPLGVGSFTQIDPFTASGIVELCRVGLNSSEFLYKL